MMCPVLLHIKHPATVSWFAQPSRLNEMLELYISENHRYTELGFFYRNTTVLPVISRKRIVEAVLDYGDVIDKK